jgi:hypothetical protein
MHGGMDLEIEFSPVHAGWPTMDEMLRPRIDRITQGSLVSASA